MIFKVPFHANLTYFVANSDIPGTRLVLSVEMVATSHSIGADSGWSGDLVTIKLDQVANF